MIRYDTFCWPRWYCPSNITWRAKQFLGYRFVEAINHKGWQAFFLFFSIFIACRGIKEAKFKAETRTPFYL